MAIKIPFSPPYIDDDVIAEVTDALKSGWITTGPKVKLLEAAIAGYAQTGHALAVNSATSAMMLVLHWFGVSRGDEVIIPAYTYAATALAVMHVGAKPVMIDAGPALKASNQPLPMSMRSFSAMMLAAELSMDINRTR